MSKISFWKYYLNNYWLGTLFAIGVPLGIIFSLDNWHWQVATAGLMIIFIALLIHMAKTAYKRF